MPDYLTAAIKVDRVPALQLMDPLRKVALRGHYDQMKMILHQDITIHFDPDSALRLQPDSPETSTDLDHPGKSLHVDLRAP